MKMTLTEAVKTGQITEVANKLRQAFNIAYMRAEDNEQILKALQTLYKELGLEEIAHTQIAKGVTFSDVAIAKMKCPCGKFHGVVPAGSRLTAFGYAWECSCGVVFAKTRRDVEEFQNILLLHKNTFERYE